MSKQKGHKQQQFNSMVQHGNLARIDPKINVVGKYQFYTVIQQDYKKQEPPSPSQIAIP